MRKYSLLMLFAFVCNLASAQNVRDQKSAFQFGLVPPLCTNGARAFEYTNVVSLNLLIGISNNEKAFTFAGLTNVVQNDASGFQFAGLSNHIGNEGRGFQFAGLANTNRMRFQGFQFAGLLNTASQMDGGQFSGLLNIARRTRGFQFAGLLNIAADVSGLQFGGLTNVSKGLQGVQFAGMTNHAGSVQGLQFSGLLNTAGDVCGLQFAGLFNVAKDVRGVQFAGLINIAENSDCPIGLINIIKNGEKGIAITYDGIGNAVVSFRSGGKYTYGILGVGYNHKIPKSGLVTEAGLGAHIPVVRWFRINNEVKVASIGCDSSTPVFNAGYSLIPAFRIGKHVELFAGVGINYMQSTDLTCRHVFPNQAFWKKESLSKLQQLYIGYQVGVHYIF